MMKRILAFLLVLAMIGLSGCGGDLQNGQSSQNYPANPNAPAGSTMLYFSMNPEFELYLDEAKIILYTEPKNEDAKTLLAQLDITGKPYVEAIATILEAAYAQGYLKDGSEIKVTLEVPQSATSNLAFIRLPISAFQREKEISIRTVISPSIDPHAGQKSVVIDGRKYTISVEPLYDGNKEALVQVGTITKYSCGWFTAEDNPTSYSRKEICHFYNGDVRVTFYHNNSILRTVIANVTGEFTDISYLLDGREYAYYTMGANGDYNYFIYNEDLTVLEAEQLQDGEFYTTKLLDDGSVHNYAAFTDRSHLESIVNSDGITVYTAEYYTDGDSTITYYYENGIVQKKEEMVVGAYILLNFDENGTLIRSERIEPDGSYRTVTTFDSNGNIIECHRYDSNGELIE